VSSDCQTRRGRQQCRPLRNWWRALEVSTAGWSERGHARGDQRRYAD